jgi:type II secretory pathway component PulF
MTGGGPQGEWFGGEEAVSAVRGMVTAGLPLESGLRALAEEAPSWRLRRLLKRMSDELSSGRSAEEVLGKASRGLPAYLSGLIRAGLEAGQLGSFLEEYLVTWRERRVARMGLWLALVYPLALSIVVTLACGLLVTWIIPQFRAIFEMFGIALPSVTLAVLALGQVLSAGWVLPVVFGLLLLPLVLFPLLRLLPGHAWRTRVMQRIPVIGTAVQMGAMSEFCSLLGLLISGRLPLAEALRLTAGTIDDANLGEGSRHLARHVECGGSLVDGVRGLPHFPRELESVFRWEARGTAFGELLRQAGVTFRYRSQMQAGLAAPILQPLLFLLLGLALGITVVALFAPLLMLMGALS